VTPYFAILRARFAAVLQYRAAAFAGFGTQLAFGLVLIYVYEAFYRSSRGPQPMALGEVVTYIWLGQALLSLLPWDTEPDVRALIRDGGVAYELLRPVDLYALWYVRTVAWRLARAALRSTPLVIVAMVFFQMRPPASLAAGLAWAAATAGAVALACAMTSLYHVSMLWTVAGEGVTTISATLVLFLSGMMIPLPLLPAWVQRITAALPFRGLVDLPFRLYIGSIPTERLAGILLEQAGWTLAFVALGRWLLNRGLRRVAVQGG
jgi:ABC-2 type transport system permease protein